MLAAAGALFDAPPGSRPPPSARTPNRASSTAERPDLATSFTGSPIAMPRHSPSSPELGEDDVAVTIFRKGGAASPQSSNCERPVARPGSGEMCNALPSGLLDDWGPMVDPTQSTDELGAWNEPLVAFCSEVPQAAVIAPRAKAVVRRASRESRRKNAEEVEERRSRSEERKVSRLLSQCPGASRDGAVKALRECDNHTLAARRMLNAGLLKPVKAEIERRPLVESDQEAERVLFQEDCNSDAARERRRTELRRFAQPVLRPGGARNRPKAPIYFSSEIADEAELKDLIDKPAVTEKTTGFSGFVAATPTFSNRLGSPTASAVRPIARRASPSPDRYTPASDLAEASGKARRAADLRHLRDLREVKRADALLAELSGEPRVPTPSPLRVRKRLQKLELMSDSVRLSAALVSTNRGALLWTRGKGAEKNLPPLSGQGADFMASVTPKTPASRVGLRDPQTLASAELGPIFSPLKRSE